MLPKIESHPYDDLGDKMKKYTQIIRDLRIQNEKTQLDIAKLLSCSRVTYCQYEHDKRGISLQRLIILSKYYDVSMDYILGVSSKKGTAYKRGVWRYSRLRYIRRKYHYSQKSLSTALFYDEDVYQSYEVGDSDTPPELIIRLALLLNIKTDYIVFGIS